MGYIQNSDQLVAKNRASVTFTMNTRASGEYSAIQRESTREGRKGCGLLATKFKALTAVGRGEKSLLYDPGSELRLGGRDKRRAKTMR